MNYLSTRGGVPPTSLADALNAGLAADGGLYVPESLPTVRPPASGSLPELAGAALAPFVAGSPLAALLPTLCADAFNFPLTIHPLPALHASVLELFHGPTAAFKDFGARFLSEALSALRADRGETTILVATSGDTGGAVAGAFFRRPGFRVVILYPDGRVSARQAHQLSAYGENIQTFKIAGSFDDCQALVKQAFADQDLRAALRLTSANSISLGRLLPQMSYYAWASQQHHAQTGERANFIIPTGNLGNAVACLLARESGWPIGRVVLAANANRVLSDFFAGGSYQPHPSLTTLANAMDVGAPSNFERLRWLYPQQQGRPEHLSAISVTDAQIQAAIVDTARLHDAVLCPHTACARVALDQLRAAGDSAHYYLAGTAHPAKFETVVEPLIGRPLDVPAGLARLLAKPAQAQALEANYAALRTQLLAQTKG